MRNLAVATTILMTRAPLTPPIAILLATLLLSSVAVRGASIDCNRATAIPGGVALVEVSLTTDPTENVNGTQNDLEFDDNLFDVSREGSEMGNCRINPNIGPGSPVGKNLFSSILSDPPRLRGFVLALSNLSPIPDGPLYSCDFLVSEDAPFGEATIFNTNLGVAPRGDTDGTDCLIDIVSPTPTATETPPCADDLDCPMGEVCVEGTCFAPTPTPTPIGFCREDADCDPGEVCVGDACTVATPTPSATPAGFCSDDRDCQGDEVCVDDRCTALTPTPTRTATPVGFCTDDGDCPDREVCIDETCTSFTPTTTATPIGFCRDDADCQNEEICVGETCTSLTPTPPPATNTPVGFCRDDVDCPEGEVCAGSRCARRTPTQPSQPASTSTATITRTPEGFCIEDGDCPVGQVCEENSCSTPEKGDNDSGCQITPTGSSADRAFLLAWLIPALVVLARWRAERPWFRRQADTRRQRRS